jgi:hypothetical protein
VNYLFSVPIPLNPFNLEKERGATEMLGTSKRLLLVLFEPERRTYEQIKGSVGPVLATVEEILILLL